ncbi:MAG: trypsin-like peptidase domain-containing protein [Thermoleophilia bacterium]
MPDSIGALIAARLDLLAVERKALLSDAAVVGRSFWARAVAAVGPREPADVLLGLHELVAKELVHPERGSAIEGETEFSFVHALVCDVAYAQLTRADRATKHAALARWLEERTAGRTEDLAEILAFHYGTALEMAGSCGLFELEDELAEPTSRYFALAGGRAAPLDATAAAAHFARAQRVADEASRPKRRWLLSRRTRRTLRRRAPLLVAALAALALAAVGALAIWEFRPAPVKPSGPVKLTDFQIASRYGTGVVSITAKVPRVIHHRLTWRRVNESGVVASKDGLIFTSGGPLANVPLAWHAQVATVAFYGSAGQYRAVQGQRLDVGSDRTIAIFKVDPRKAQLNPIPLGDSESVNIRDTVVTLGRVFSDLQRADGEIGNVLSGQSPTTGAEIVTAMRTTAVFAKPATGGPLIDTTGHLLGVMGEPFNDAESGPASPGYAGRDAAVAVSYFTNAAAWYEREEYGGPSAWLGVSVRPVTAPLARSLGLAAHTGLLVQFVAPGGPGARAGIRGGTRVIQVRPRLRVLGGDVIVSVDGRPVKTVMDLYTITYKRTPGGVVAIHLFRGSTPMTVKAKLEPYLVFNPDWL